MRNKINTILQWIAFTSIAFLIVTADSLPNWALAILVVATLIAFGAYRQDKIDASSETPIGDKLAREMGLGVRDFIVKDGQMDDVA